MRTVFIIFVVACIGYYIQNTYDFSGIRDKAMSALQGEKTIKTINQKRAQDQLDVYSVQKN